MDMDEQTIYMDEEEELSYYKSITGELSLIVQG